MSALGLKLMVSDQLREFWMGLTKEGNGAR